LRKQNKLPSFFRYSYIIDAEWSFRRRKRFHITVHGLVFTFGPPSDDIKNLVINETWDVFERIIPEWAEFWEAEEEERVLADEARGVGFYYVHVLVNEKLVKKVHARHRRFGERFYEVALQAIFDFVQRFRKWLAL